MKTMYELVVAPLVEHARRVELETGRRVDIEITVPRDDFDRILAELGHAYPFDCTAYPVHGRVLLKVAPEPVMFRATDSGQRITLIDD